ncbi:DUF2291 domain-containing protein [Paraflavisolibacter sp. H34]|uniref:DUF2291 domain-containing protein n=1 Tax=Huijunlia imazamoxiresistens TaxID=3127457 RepID=UPI00301882F6
MQKRVLKYVAGIAALVVLGYNSVYFKKLDEVKAASASKQFDAVTYARNYLGKRLKPSLHQAIEVGELTTLLQLDPKGTFEKHSHALGIGNIRFFLVKGEGTITALGEDAATLAIQKDTTSRKVKIATEFVFGNAVRDASGLININEFNNTMDFNNVSAEINKIIRSEVLPPFKKAAKPGDRVQFTGAVELNRLHVSTDSLEIIPISLEIKK